MKSILSEDKEAENPISSPTMTGLSVIKSEEVLPQTNIKVLVVDDNAMNRNMLSKMLQRLECSTICVCDGSEAVKAIANENFRIIFMDLQMPVMDGFEATRRIRKMKENIPIVAVSANSQEEELPKCIDAGMNDFLWKPVRAAKLKEFVEKYK